VIQQAPVASNQPPAAAAPLPQSNPMAPQSPALAAAPPGPAAPPQGSDPTLASGVIAPAQPLAQAAGSTLGHPKYDFPSSSSIPAVSIMAPEPGTPAAAEAKPAARRTARSPAQRNQPQPAPAPQQAAPPAQTSGQR
jgi:hypothetical protein